MLATIMCLIFGHGPTMTLCAPRRVRLQCQRCRRVSPGWEV